MNNPVKREAGEMRGEPPTIVGIGASAGGLAALQGFFDALPADCGFAFVVVARLNPEPESLLAELLQEQTEMAVQPVSGLTPIKRNQVYVASANQCIDVTDTHLDAQDFKEPGGQRQPIDFFFGNLAKTRHEAVAVILSGGGTDGVAGARAIKQRGGLLMVQDPKEAEYDSLPQAAISTGLPDVVGKVAHLANKLATDRRPTPWLSQTPEAERETRLALLQEEVQRLHGQLQATTEALQSSEEELQSVSEELQSVKTELQNKLEEIAQTRNAMEDLMVATGIATLFLDRQLRIQRYTPTTVDLFNLIPPDRERSIAHLTRTLSYDALEEDVAQVLETLVPIEREVRAAPDDPDGSWLLVRLRPYRTADDKVEGIVLTFVDISELKQTQTALQLSQARLRLAQESAGVGTFEWNIQTGVNSWTPELEQLYGLAPGSFEGTYEAWAALVHPEDLRQSEQAVQEALESGRFVAEWRAVQPDGDIVWILARGWVEMDAQGGPVRMIGANVDISDRKKYEQALAESEARYRALAETLEERVLRRTAALRRSEERLRKLIEASAAAVWTTNAQGQVVEDSPSWRAYTGQTLAEWLGDGWTAAVHPRDRDLAFRHWTESVESASPLNTEYRIYHTASEQWRWINVRAVPLRDQEGKVRGWIGMNIDIDDRRQAEQAVHQLAADLTLVEQRERDRIAQILHDELQQQLYAVRLQLTLLEDTQDGGDEALFAQELAATQELLAQSLATTRQLNVDLSPPILRDEGLPEALVWLATQMEQQHHLVVTIDSKAPIVIGDEGLQVLLFQTVRELLFNIVKHAETNHAEVRLRQESDQVIITVKDEGRGFDAASILADRRSGSGLTAFRHRLTLVGGQMDIESSPAEGARITVSAPLQTD